MTSFADPDVTCDHAPSARDHARIVTPSGPVAVRVRTLSGAARSGPVAVAIAVCLLVSSQSVADPTNAPEPVFSQLDDEVWIEVDYQSRGCFHSRRRRFSIRGGARPEVVISTPGLFPEEADRGVLALSHEDLVGLDRLIDVYRSPDGGTCTTRDEVKLRWRTRRIVPATVRTEEYVDETCRVREVEGVLTFEALLRRLSEPDPG